ncbi:hypothetical protein GCM10011341_31070 [Frigidibacter albus]|nr:hypothetical protein GCM10011341_31070 [Frigidibacter albus]
MCNEISVRRDDGEDDEDSDEQEQGCFNHRGTDGKEGNSWLTELGMWSTGEGASFVANASQVWCDSSPVNPLRASLTGFIVQAKRGA